MKFHEIFLFIFIYLISRFFSNFLDRCASLTFSSTFSAIVLNPLERSSCFIGLILNATCKTTEEVKKNIHKSNWRWPIIIPAPGTYKKKYVMDVRTSYAKYRFFTLPSSSSLYYTSVSHVFVYISMSRKRK